MAIQMRRGARADLDVTRLLPGEYAVCTDGYIYLKINGSQVVRIATSELLEQVLSQCADYADDCETYMNNAMYTYIMFSRYPDGTDMTDTPDEDTRYIGIYTGHSSTRPINKALYQWINVMIAIDPHDAYFNINDSNGHLYMNTDKYNFGINNMDGHLVIYS